MSASCAFEVLGAALDGFTTPTCHGVHYYLLFLSSANYYLVVFYDC